MSSHRNWRLPILSDPRIRFGIFAVTAVVFSCLISSAYGAKSQSFLSEHSESWAYDVTTALCIAAIWWFAEYASSRSQTYLFSCSDWNYAWSIASLLLAIFCVIAFVIEQYLRSVHKCSLPTTTATLVASSLSYVLVPDRFRFFDEDVKLLQNILRMHKLRFGDRRPGRQPKYIIVWMRFRKGDPNNTWKLFDYHKMKYDQVLVDWGIDHRTGRLYAKDISAAVREREDSYWGLIGSLLYNWLPSESFEHLNLENWRRLGKLKGAYEGGRGRRYGCDKDVESFDEWITKKKVSEVHFKLSAIEFKDATTEFVSTIPDIIKQADTPQKTAELFISNWKNCIDEWYRKRDNK